MGPPLLQTTHIALSVINITIFLINALIIFVKDVIKETLVITRDFVFFNHKDLNLDLLLPNNKPNKLESIT